MTEIKSTIGDWSLTFNVSADVLENEFGHDLGQENLEKVTIMPFQDLLEEAFVADELWGKFFAAWQQRYNLPRSIRVLMAHGGYDHNNHWCYLENDQIVGSVHSWIGKYDGKNTLLATCCCNPSAAYLPIRRSLLLLSNGIISNMSIDKSAYFNVITPVGIQSPMTLEYDLTQLAIP